MNCKLFGLLPLLVLAGPAMLCFGQDESTPAYMNTKLSFEERARDLERRIVNGTVKAWIGGGQPPAAANRLSGDGVSVQFTITSERMLPN
jgi:hypothetical protein